MGKRKSRTEAPEDQPNGATTSGQPTKIAKTDATPIWRNKEKVLLLSSRGITYRFEGLPSRQVLTVAVIYRYRSLCAGPEAAVLLCTDTGI